MTDKLKALRERHAAGVARLNSIFDWTKEDDDRLQKAKRDSFSKEERQTRRQRNREARAARRRNRT